VYIGPKSRTERPRKTKIGTELTHVTCDLDTTLKVRRSKVKVTGVGAYCGGLPHSLFKQFVTQSLTQSSLYNSDYAVKCTVMCTGYHAVP